MPHWKIKAAIQGTLSRLPNPQRWNRLFQKYVTGSLVLSDAYFLQKWRQCERHVANLAKAGLTAGHTVMELGTGWFPISPIGLALAGAKTVYSVDRQSLLERERVVTTLEFYLRLLKGGQVGLPAAAVGRVEEALRQAGPLNAVQILELLGVRCLITDARQVAMEAGAVDAFISNNTLEHIPGDIILGIFREFHRLGSGSSVMSHFIDMADHYANFDHSISVLNFLQYSDHGWRWYNNELQYVNRLRVTDFRKLHQQSGWSLASEDNTLAPVADLQRLRIADEFKHLSQDELLAYATWMVSRRGGL